MRPRALQNILPGITGPIMGQPETYLTMVGDAFNDKGELVKESLQKVLEQFLTAFAAWVEKQNAVVDPRHERAQRSASRAARARG